MNKIFLEQIKKIKADTLRFKKSKKNSKNNKNFFIKTDNVYFDYSRNTFDDKLIKKLLNLAEIIDIKNKYKELINGHEVNISEKRKVLHPALRRVSPSLDKSISKKIYDHKDYLKKLSNDIRSGRKKSFSNKNYTDIVSIGTGGSFFGIKAVYESLKNYSSVKIKLHFISNLDFTENRDLLLKLNPKTTLFIVVSKSFRTIETIENIKKIKQWLNKSSNKSNIMNNFLAVTENDSEALKLGIHEDNIIKIWDWLGGRYSIWSGVSIGLIIAIGYTNFNKFLNGAEKADKHFSQSKYNKNIPVIMALISFYYTTYFGAQSHLILPYNYRLRFLQDHIQQLEMESNGKSLDVDGKSISSKPGNIVWGGSGSCSQHSFYQLLHQGNLIIPSDFIISKKSDCGSQDNHDMLFSNFLSHLEILNKGFSKLQATELYEKKFSNQGLDEELVIRNLMLSGKNPANAILLNQLSPESLGELIAFYEHKTYVLGLLYGINSFDQWAVEIGKIKAVEIYDDIREAKRKNKKTNIKIMKEYLN